MDNDIRKELDKPTTDEESEQAVGGFILPKPFGSKKRIKCMECGKVYTFIPIPGFKRTCECGSTRFMAIPEVGFKA